MAKNPQPPSGDPTEPDQTPPSRSSRSRSRRDELEAMRLAQAAKDRRFKVIWAGVGTVLIALIAAVTIWALAGSKSAGGDVIPPHGDQARTAVIFDASYVSAPTLDIFSDFQCPGCQGYHKVLGETISEIIESGQVKVSFHTMTFLDSSNVRVNSVNKKSSTRAAIGAACADVQGFYVAYYDQVYDYTPSLENEGQGFPDTLLRDLLPAYAGMEDEALEQFKQCYDDKATGQFVAAVAEASSKGLADLGAGGTPTFAINGQDMTQEIGTATDPALKLKQLLGLT